MRQRAAKVRRRDPSGMTPAEQLAAISRRAHRMVDEQAAGVRDVLRAAGRARPARLAARASGPPSSGSSCNRYFAREILPILTPLAVEELTPRPLLPGLQLHVAARARPATAAERDESAGRRTDRRRAGAQPVAAVGARCRPRRTCTWRGWKT